MIDAETTIITPNRRLAALLQQQQLAALQQENCVKTADILPLTAWLERLFRDDTRLTFTELPYLLNTRQEQFLWEKIITETNAHHQLLQLAETANMARAAFVMLNQWQIAITDDAFQQADDYLALQQWAQQFTRTCDEKNCIAALTLPDYLGKKIAKNSILLPKKLVLVGFTEQAPQLQNFLSIIEKAGCTVEITALTQQNAACRRLALADTDDEIVNMALWAKAMHDNEPTTRIGCVLPALEKMRDRVLQIFSSVFAMPGVDRIASDVAPFNISAGKNLLHYPIIHCALECLHLYKQTISIETLSYLLTSPFLGHANVERSKRAAFDGKLRQHNIHHIALSSLIAATTKQKSPSLSESCPQLARQITAFLICLQENITQNNQQKTYQDWALLFTQLLTLLGWPGERSLNSEEYQIVDAWLDMLHDYALLDHVATPVEWHDALQTLHQFASKTLFQPKTPAAPIQILGVLEAAGMPFDALWVAGFDDIAWPPQPQPNPFIPKTLQRKLHLPHATAQRELQFCKSLLQQFKQSAKQVIFSYAAKKDALELQVSPLIRDVIEIAVTDLVLATYEAPIDKLYATRLIENLVDNVGPAVTATEKIRGGVNVIKWQALCPFKAFAEWRLHAREMEAPLPGLRAKDRGTILHKILELVWEKLQNQANLLAMSTSALQALIAECIDHALTEVTHAHSASTQYLALEKSRLLKLTSQWLQHEKERPPFTVINNEKSTTITLNQLSLTLRIDRVDQLSDGKKLIIDYKTGKNNDVSAWFGDRPEEPQLPLYALLDKNNHVGLTFAQITTGDYLFKGVSHADIAIAGIKSLSRVKLTTALSWAEQLEAWETVMLRLSDEFYHGEAAVDPKHATQTCTYCALQPLCRINEEQDEQHEY